MRIFLGNKRPGLCPGSAFFMIIVFLILGLTISPGYADVDALMVIAPNDSKTNTDDLSSTTKIRGFYLNDGASLTNSGSMTLNIGTSTPPYAAYGLYATGNNTINNSGDFSITTADYKAYAFTFTANSTGNTLTNTGVILTSPGGGRQGYEVLLGGNAELTLKDTYTMTLDGQPNSFTPGYSFYLYSGATLHLNGATLEVAEVDSTVMGVPYRIFKLEDDTATVDGHFDKVVAKNPNITVTYLDMENDDLAFNDAVYLEYGVADPVSPFPQATSLTVKALALAGGVMDQRMAASFLVADNARDKAVLVADSGAIASDAGNGYMKADPDWQFFFTPYYTRTRRSADPSGYEANSGGASFGFERRNDAMLYGFHLGAGTTKIDYRGRGLDGNDEDQNLFTAGVHAMGRVRDWTWRARVTPFYAQSDYEGLTGTNLTVKETADYHTMGLSTSLVGGYMFRLGRHTLMPELGMDYVYAYRESFTTDAANPTWKMNCESLDMNQVTARTDLRWMTQVQNGKWVLTPSASAGLRLLLTDDDITVRQSISGNAPFSVTSSQDDVAGTLSLSLDINTGKAISTIIAYDGELSEETTRHSIWAKFSFAF